MTAPQRFVAWLSGHVAKDHKFGRKVFHYHPRSDEHSKTICKLVLQDVMAACPLLAEHARAGVVVGGINTSCTLASSKCKTLDLAIGTPAASEAGTEVITASAGESLYDVPLRPGSIGHLRIACEAKQCMTEHGKTQPRIFDELSSSHGIVHHAEPEAIAAGIVVVNIAAQYASPTRQTTKRGPLVMTQHRQPAVTESMVRHLRGLVVREKVGEVGFDAFATIVINCDNVGPCALHTGPPAPQAGERDHYQSFVERISRAYVDRFGG